MNRAHLISAFLLLTACGGDEEEAAPAAASAEPTTETQPAAPQPAAQPAPTQPAPSGESNFGTIALRAGFLPDPHTATGSSGGAVQASTLNAACAGYVSGTPDHLLNAQTAFSTLRILARSEGDVTLVVQRPDGTYACDDDTEGTNPVVQIEQAASGTYRIWIGSYAEGQSSPYTLGVTELSSTMPSSL